MTVLPSERPRRSFLYRELESAGANFEELNGATAAMRFGDDAAGGSGAGTQPRPLRSFGPKAHRFQRLEHGRLAHIPRRGIG